jgi:hypothetical protein
VQFRIGFGLFVGYNSGTHTKILLQEQVSMLEIYAPKDMTAVENGLQQDVSAKLAEEVTALNNKRDLKQSKDATEVEQEIACGCSGGQSPAPYRYDPYQGGYYSPRPYYTPAPNEGYYNQGAPGYDSSRYVAPTYVPVRTERGIILVPAVRPY